MDTRIARGYIMTLMVFIQNIHIFNCRSELKSAFKVSIKNNYFIFLSIAGTLLLQFAVMEVPLLSRFLQTSSIPTFALLGLFLTSTSILLIMEVYKLLGRLVRKEKS